MTALTWFGIVLWLQLWLKILYLSRDNGGGYLLHCCNGDRGNISHLGLLHNGCHFSLKHCFLFLHVGFIFLCWQKNKIKKIILWVQVVSIVSLRTVQANCFCISCMHNIHWQSLYLCSLCYIFGTAVCHHCSIHWPSSSRLAEAETSPSLFLANTAYSPASSAKVMEISKRHSPVSFL